MSVISRIVLEDEKEYGIFYWKDMRSMVLSNKILTPLQEAVLHELFSLTDEFYLTGGTALSAYYLEHRLSIDLDFFTQEEIAFNNVRVLVKKTADTLCKDFEIVNDSSYFKHFDIIETRAEENENKLTLHFSLDVVEQFSKSKNQFDGVIVDTEEEILVNKICAITGRSELKDLIDLYFLGKKYKVLDYLKYAQKKDGGVEKEVFAYCLNNVIMDFSEKMTIKPCSEKDLISFREDLIQQCLTMQGYGQ